MDLYVSRNFPLSSYTLTNCISSAGGTNFEVRVGNSLSFVGFSSNIYVSLKACNNPNDE